MTTMLCVRRLLLRQHGSDNSVVIPVRYRHQHLHERRSEQQSSRLAEKGRCQSRTVDSVPTRSSFNRLAC